MANDGAGIPDGQPGGLRRRVRALQQHARDRLRARTNRIVLGYLALLL